LPIRVDEPDVLSGQYVSGQGAERVGGIRNVLWLYAFQTAAIQ
jgi:hypothetical protein